MKSLLLILGTGITAYVVETILVAGFLAFLMERKAKEFSFFIAIPLLALFFAANEFYYLPAIIKANVSFTINNPELASFFEVEPNESLTKFVLDNFISITTWVIEASLSYGIAIFLVRRKKPGSLEQN